MILSFTKAIPLTKPMGGGVEKFVRIGNSGFPILEKNACYGLRPTAVECLICTPRFVGLRTVHLHDLDNPDDSQSREITLPFFNIMIPQAIDSKVIVTQHEAFFLPRENTIAEIYKLRNGDILDIRTLQNRLSQELFSRLKTLDKDQAEIAAILKKASYAPVNLSWPESSQTAFKAYALNNPLACKSTAHHIKQP